jgi:hypothetical protein
MIISFDLPNASISCLLFNPCTFDCAIPSFLAAAASFFLLFSAGKL